MRTLARNSDAVEWQLRLPQRLPAATADTIFDDAEGWQED